jgi:hypothetical protein
VEQTFIQEYSELLKHKPSGWRARVRHSLLDVLSMTSGNEGKAAAWLKKPRIQFLYIHHIFKDEIAQLRQMLNHLAQHHQFISYSDAVNKILQGSIDKPYICISSDDGLKNNLDAGAVLREFGISACFFICPSMIGVTDAEKIAAFTKERLHFPPVEFLSWNEVDALQKQGHEIGGHTMSHVNIAGTPSTAFDYEIRECYEVISGHCGTPLHFAYPYGRHHNFSQQGRQAVFAAGFSSCASAERGCHIVGPGQTLTPEELLIRRDHIILAWPWRHIRYFLVENSKKANVQTNYYPSYAGSNTNQ